MKKLAILLLCLSSVPLWSMEQVQENLENMSLVSNGQPVFTSPFKSPLDQREFMINDLKKTMDDEEWTALPMAERVGLEYARLQDVASEKEQSLDKEKLQDLVDILFTVYDSLIEKLGEQIEMFQERIREYDHSTDAEKAAQEPSLLYTHDMVVSLYNALTATTMEESYSEIENNLPLMYARITAARQALGLE